MNNDNKVTTDELTGSTIGDHGTLDITKPWYYTMAYIPLLDKDKYFILLGPEGGIPAGNDKDLSKRVFVEGLTHMRGEGQRYRKAAAAIAEDLQISVVEASGDFTEYFHGLYADDKKEVSVQKAQLGPLTLHLVLIGPDALKPGKDLFESGEKLDLRDPATHAEDYAAYLASKAEHDANPVKFHIKELAEDLGLPIEVVEKFAPKTDEEFHGTEKHTIH